MATTTLYNTLNSEISTLNQSITTNTNNITNLTTRVGNAETKISNLESKVSPIGTIVEKNYTKSVNPNNTTVTLSCAVKLTAGTWVIYGQANFPKSIAGSRQGITITTDATSGAYNAWAYDLKYQGTASSANQYYNVATIVSPTATTTYYLMAFSGNHTSAINIAGYLRAVRIA